MNRITAMTVALLAIPLEVPPTLWAQPSRDQTAETITVRLSSFAFNPDQLRLRVDVPVRHHLEIKAVRSQLQRARILCRQHLPDWFTATKWESRGRWQE